MTVRTVYTNNLFIIYCHCVNIFSGLLKNIIILQEKHERYLKDYYRGVYILVLIVVHYYVNTIIFFSQTI